MSEIKPVLSAQDWELERTLSRTPNPFGSNPPAKSAFGRPEEPQVLVERIALANDAPVRGLTSHTRIFITPPLFFSEETSHGHDRRRAPDAGR